MAERRGTHVWSTPKAGITFVDRYFKDIHTNNDYKFIIVRNPYHRLVSFYINKIIWRGENPNTTVITINPYYETSVPHYEKLKTSVSFRDFIISLENENPKYLERHLKLQSELVEHITFDKIVKLENYKEDIKDVCTELNLDYNYYSSLRKVNSSDKININIDDAYLKSASWFRINGTPSDFNLFLQDDTIKEIIYKKYQKDFELFGYSK